MVSKTQKFLLFGILGLIIVSVVILATNLSFPFGSYLWVNRSLINFTDRTIKANDDIFLKDVKVYFGTGWYDAEKFNNEKLRWTNGDASLAVMLNPEDYEITMDVISASRPRECKIYLNGKLSIEKEISADFNNSTQLSLKGYFKKGINIIRIVSQTGGVVPAQTIQSNDTRTLAFLIKNISVKTLIQSDEDFVQSYKDLIKSYKAKEDIFSSDVNVAFGPGWQDLEFLNQEPFRWTNGDASLVILSGQELPEITMKVTSAIRSRECDIYVNGRLSYEEVIRSDLQNLTLVSIAKNLKKGLNSVRIVSKIGGERPAFSQQSADTRTLAFLIKDFKIK